MFFFIGGDQFLSHHKLSFSVVLLLNSTTQRCVRMYTGAFVVTLAMLLRLKLSFYYYYYYQHLACVHGEQSLSSFF